MSRNRETFGASPVVVGARGRGLAGPLLAHGRTDSAGPEWVRLSGCDSHSSMVRAPGIVVAGRGRRTRVAACGGQHAETANRRRRGAAASVAGFICNPWRGCGGQGKTASSASSTVQPLTRRRCATKNPSVPVRRGVISRPSAETRTAARNAPAAALAPALPRRAGAKCRYGASPHTCWPPLM
jgi:hypothetical protein